MERNFRNMDSEMSVLRRRCNYRMWIKTEVMKKVFGFDKIERGYRDKVLDIKSFMCSFECVIKEYFEIYGVNYNAEDRARGGEREFENSVMKKAIIIAQDIFYGSMMCNYYTNQFATYNNVQNSIGYDMEK